MIRRLSAGALVCVAATAIAVGSASAVPPSGKVGPNQVFGALVNGKNGVTTPAPIRMACFGPVRPGQRGHPMAGQTVEVFRPEAIVVAHPGFTAKNATSIVAFFGPPPPAPATPAASTVTFKKYGVKKPIPTSVLLPCAGSGTVHFVPLPKSPPKSRDATVRVAYIGQP